MAIIPHPLHTLQSPSPAPLHATSPSSAWTKLQVPEDQIEARKVPMQSSQKLKLYPNWIPFHPSIPMSWLMRKKKKMMRDYRLMTKHWIELQSRRIRIQVKLLPQLQIHLIMYCVYPWSKNTLKKSHFFKIMIKTILQKKFEFSRQKCSIHLNFISIFPVCFC